MVMRKRTNLIRLEEAKYKKSINVVTFARELNLAGVSAKAKDRSIVLQQGVTTREARLAIKLTKRKKHRSRR
jgi:hypothetical protein